MFKELGISCGTYLIVLISLYFVIKWAVKNGIKDAYEDITGKDITYGGDDDDEFDEADTEEMDSDNL